MALINCPECGHQISDKAEECPKCGYPIELSKVLEDSKPNGVNGNLKIRITFIVIISFALLISIIGLIWFNGHSHHREGNSVLSDSISTETVAPITYGYIDKDSLIYNCGFGKEFLAYSEEQMDNYDTKKRDIDEQIKGLWDKFNLKKANYGFLTESQMDTEFNYIKKKELEYQNKLRDFEGRINKNIAQHRAMLNDTIQKYAMRFAQSNKFEALFINEDTLWRNIIINPDCNVNALDIVMNPQFNVTMDFVNFLNQYCDPKILVEEQKIEEGGRVVEERNEQEFKAFLDWAEGTWEYKGDYSTVIVVISGNHVYNTFDGEINYNGVYDIYDGAMHFGDNYIPIDYGGKRLMADKSHYFTKMSESKTPPQRRTITSFRNDANVWTYMQNIRWESIEGNTIQLTSKGLTINGVKANCYTPHDITELSSDYAKIVVELINPRAILVFRVYPQKDLMIDNEGNRYTGLR